MNLETESNQRPGGTRTVCDLRLKGVTQVVGEQDWDSVLELGDIVLCRTSGHWLSRTISSLDGYWTHSTIYVGAGKVAHASAGGIGTASLGYLADHYEDCMGFARPNLDESKRTAAAQWAREACRIDGEYSGYDLGLAFSLLARARLRAALDDLPFLGSGENVEDVKPRSDGLEGIEPEISATCSGFVYTAYKESGSELNIKPAPGIVLNNDGQLVLLEEMKAESSLQDYLESLDDGPAGDLEMFTREDIENWITVATIVKSAVAASVGQALADDDDQAIPVEKGVTPGDLWCSPQIADKGFLSSNFMAHAHSKSADCGGTETQEQP